MPSRPPLNNSRSVVLASLREIKHAPDDDGLRLRLADHLSEHDDPRGEFIRLQLDLARLSPYDPEHARTQERARRLQDRHQVEWLGPLVEPATGWEFRRGLLTLEMPVEVFADKAIKPALDSEAYAWVDLLKLRDFSTGALKKLAKVEERELPPGLDLSPEIINVFLGDVEDAEIFASWPLLGQVRSLNLYHLGILDAGLAAILSSPHLGPLHTLILGENEVKTKAARALASAKCLSGLTRLDLDCTSLTPKTLGTILGSKHLSRLRTLNLDANGLRESGIKVLAESPNVAEVVELRLQHNQIDDKAAKGLADSPHLGSLRRLDLRNNHIYAKGVQALFRSRSLTDLEELRLYGNLLHEANAATFASTRFTNLRVLDLESMAVKDEPVAALVALPGLKNLEELNLKRGHITAQSARAIAASPHLGKLRLLDLGETQIDPDVARSLAGSASSANLRYVNLAHTYGTPGVGDEGAKAIAASKHLNQLTRLDIPANTFTIEGVRALLTSPNVRHLHTLNIAGCELGTELTRAIADSTCGENLHHLSVVGCKLGAEALRELLRPGRLPHLVTLDLSENPLGPDGLRVLAGWSGLAEIHELKLSHTNPGLDGVSALLESGRLEALRSLDLSSNELPTPVASLLAEWPGLRHLTRLALDNDPIELEGVWAILSSPHCTRFLEMGLKGHGGPIFEDIVERREGPPMGATGRPPLAVRKKGVIGPLSKAEQHCIDRLPGICPRDRCDPVRTIVPLGPRQTSDDHVAVFEIAFTPDGKHLAGACEDGCARLWFVTTGATALEHRVAESYCGAVALSPEGKLLAIGSETELHLVERETDTVRFAVPTDQGFIHRLSFSPDGRLIASGNDRETVTLWDAGSGEVIRLLEGHGGEVHCVAFSPDGRWLVSESAYEGVLWWEVKTGRRSATIELRDNVSALAFSPDGKWLVSGTGTGFDGEGLRIWDAVTRKRAHTFDLGRQSVQSLAFSPDGRLLGSGDSRGAIHLWDTGTGRRLRTLTALRLPGSCCEPGCAFRVAFTPDGKHVAASCWDGGLRLWDVGDLARQPRKKGGSRLHR